MTDRLPGTADADGWRRLHPLSPLLRGGLALIVIVGIIIANARDWLVRIFVTDRIDGGASQGFDEGDPVSEIMKRGWTLPAIGIALGVILLIVFFSWIAWRFHTYRITDEAVEARTGVLFRQHRRAPLERIQSVNLQRSLLARAVGLTKIDIVTAGQGGKVELAYLGHRDAKLVREQILGAAARKRDGSAQPAVGDADSGRVIAAIDPVTGLPPVAPASDPGATAEAPTDFAGVSYGAPTDKLTGRAQDFVDADIDPASAAEGSLVRVPVGRLIGSIFLSWESLTAIGLLILVLVGGAAGLLRALAENGEGLIRLGSSIALGMMVSIVPLVLVFAGILIGQFNKGFNFAISRGRDAVRIGAGLTSTTTESIPFGRIHAVEARQPLFWRPFGWWKLRVTTAGHSVAQGGQNNVQNVVLPVGREDDVVRVIDALLPGSGDEATGRSALREGLSGAHPAGYLGAGPRAGWVLWWGRRRAGLRIADPELQSATLLVRRGFLTRSLSVMPVLRAQSVQLRRPLMHRALGLASIAAHTVLGPVRMEMRGIALPEAQREFDALTRTVLAVQGAEAEERAESVADRVLPEMPGAAGAAGAPGAPVAPAAPVAPVAAPSEAPAAPAAAPTEPAESAAQEPQTPSAPLRRPRGADRISAPDPGQNPGKESEQGPEQEPQQRPEQ